MEVLIADIGYGDTKFAYEEKGKLRLGKFPSAIVRRGPETKTVDTELAGLKGETGELVYNGAVYVVGEEALFEGTPISTRRKDFIPRFSPIIVAKIIQKLRKEFEGIIISAAVSDLTEENRKAVKEALSSFTVNGRNFSFSDIRIFPQGYGIYRDIFPQGHPGLVVVADIGFNTIDISTYMAGKPVRRNIIGLPGYGTSRVVQRLIDRVRQELGEPVTEIEINRALQKDKKLRIYNRTVDLSDWFEEERNFYAEDVLAQIESSPIGQIWKRADVRIIGGGGGYFIPQGFANEMDVIIPDKPEFSNVRGFWKAINEVKDE